MKNKTKQILSIVVLIIAAYFGNNYTQEEKNNGKTNTTASFDLRDTNNEELNQLIKSRKSNQIITIRAKIINILSDDTKGDRHQKMIVKVGNNTLLLAHNIDLAPRLPVQNGDILVIKGEYEWNQKGGVIHWTHKSTGKHANGWIKFNNKKYH